MCINYTLELANEPNMFKIMPALASGCTMILKPSEVAPLSAMILTELIDEAGFPPGFSI